MLKNRYLLLVLLLSVMSCRTSVEVLEKGASTDTYYQIDSNLENDQQIAALIAPFVTDLRNRMNMVIAYSENEIDRGRPEGPLNNLSADIVRFRAIRELGKPVEIGVVNYGGLRAPLPKGNITVGNVYELMPFENFISVLELTGHQVQIMANQIAARGGEPVSGIRFRIENGRAVDILVGHQPLQSDKTYLVATNSFMADGGDGVSVFTEAIERTDLPVLIRDAMIEYIRVKRLLDYQLEQRIRVSEVNP